jgi:isopentenyl phosphate kinase
VIVVKLGGAVITGWKHGRPAYDSAATRNLAEVLREAGGPLIVTHGTGTIGRAVLAGYDTTTTISVAREPVAHDVQLTLRRLHHCVIRELRSSGLPARSFDPESVFEISGGRVVWAGLELLRRAVRRGEVPVLSGGTYRTREGEYGILSSDRILEHLAAHLDVDRVVIATNVDGVLDETRHAVIPELTPDTRGQMWRQPYDERDATGGMTSKVEVCFNLAARGREVHIVSGKRPQAFLAALRGRPSIGTTVKC